MEDKITYQGKLFQVLQRKKEVSFRVGNETVSKQLEIELVRRAPGVRALIVDGEKILLNREYRYELEAWDYRLPGGKVYDTCEDYGTGIRNATVDADIVEALKRETLEEAGIQVKEWKQINVSHCGLTVEWDLYYFLVEEYTDLSGVAVQKSEYEFIESCWVDYAAALELCLNGGVTEARSAYEIMRYILQNQKGESTDGIQG